MNVEEVKRLREERGIGLMEARAIVRHRERLARLQELHRHARGVLRDLIALMLEEELGE